MHGGAPAALLARAIERFEPGPASHIARLTVELLRPVPLAPLTVTTRMARPGKKVQPVEASLFAGDQEVVRTTGLRLRVAPLDLPPGLAPEYPVPPRGRIVPRDRDVDDWPVGLDALTVPEAAGVGMAESVLFDGEGRIGRAVQSLLLDRR